MDYTSPDVYRTRALVTRGRRAAQHKTAKALQMALNAYQAAFVAARKSGEPLPKLADYVSKTGVVYAAK